MVTEGAARPSLLLMRHKLNETHMARFSKECLDHITRLRLDAIPVSFKLGVDRISHTPGMLATTRVVPLNNRVFISLASTWPMEPTDRMLDYVALHEALELMFLLRMHGPVVEMAGKGFDKTRWDTATHDALHCLMAWMRPDLMVDTV